MIADFFREDPDRFTRFQAETGGILFDYSIHRVDGTGLRLPMDLARAADIEALAPHKVVEGVRPVQHFSLSQNVAARAQSVDCSL
jgi:hypothetical protein